MKPLGSDTVPIDLSQPPRIVYFANGRFSEESAGIYRLDDCWALHLYNYDANLIVDGKQHFSIRPGTIGLTPPGASVEYRWPRSHCVHACAHFHLPRAGASAVRIPWLVDFQSDYLGWHDRVQAAIGTWPVTPRRAEALIWDLLWGLVERNSRVGADDPDGHPKVNSAMSYIERKLDVPLSVADVAAHVELSHNHLTRLFKQFKQSTVVGYIRRRRGQRAYRLLRDSSMPVMAVSLAVGITNLQQFNKLMRREHGRSPRQIRCGNRKGT